VANYQSPFIDYGSRVNARRAFTLIRPTSDLRCLTSLRAIGSTEPEAGFTLIELLVVIIMIAILAALLYPAINGAQNQAKKVQAKNDVTQIVSAVNAYYTEYGKYPIDSTAPGYVPADTYYGSGTAPSGITVTYGNDKLIDVLRDNTASPVNGTLVTTLNPRGIIFLSLPSVKNQDQPRAGIATKSGTINGISIVIGSFWDPWGMPYNVAIDGNYDNQIANPYPNGSAGGVATTTPPYALQIGVIAWSLGSDQKLGTNGDGVYRTSGGAQSDDVISWQ